MNDNLLMLKTQELVNKGEPAEAMNFIFDTYLEEHPEARSLELFREKVSLKINTAFPNKDPELIERSKLLVYAFTTVIGHSEGDTAFNLVLLLMHLLEKGHGESIKEAIELIKLEKASKNLNLAS